MSRNFKAILLSLFVLSLSGCATQLSKKDYTDLRTEAPRSILVVPAINRSVEAVSYTHLTLPTICSV